MQEISKSCFNCKYLSRFRSPATQYEPEFSEWGCKHAKQNDFPDPSECLDDSDDDTVGKFYALECLGYEFFDWDEFDRIQAQAEVEMEKELSISEAEQIELESIREFNETSRLISIGLLDKMGNPTDEYYRLSEQQYDARR